ncbi:MAG: biotin/lipoyl-binding protein, partial [Bacteroidia bacterium]|nr:biotin/lipoyl-binding protein [Bacteroidia bacterium]
MAQVELIMPKMGESVAEATITKWLKNEGESVEADESVLEIATDKVDSEVPSPSDGVISKVLFAEGDVVKVGEVIAILETEGSAGVSTPAPAQQPVAEPAPKTTPQPVASAPAVVSTPVAAPVLSSNGSGTTRFYSPLVRNIASQEGIGQAELDSIPGSGASGRVTKKDLLSYLDDRQSTPSA